MTRKTFVIVLCVLMILAVIPLAQAASRANTATSTMTFNGTTAVCTANCSALNQEITITMKLYHDNSCIAIWTTTGTSSAGMTRYKTALESGETYVLKVSGTAGSESFTCTPVSRTCP